MEQERPKEFLKGTNDRFTDFCGNPLLALETNIESWKRKPEEEARLESVRRTWDKFFNRLDMFLQQGFEPEGNITEENIRKLLVLRERDVTSHPEVMDELAEAYKDMVSVAEI